MKTMLPTIWHFELMKDIEKNKSVLPISIVKLAATAFKNFCKNLKLMKKDLTAYYTNWWLIKYSELKQKYALSQIRVYSSYQNPNAKTSKKIKVKLMLGKKSYQLRVFAIKNLKQNCLQVNSVADVWVYNNKRIMINFEGKPTKIGRWILDSILPGKKKAKITLILNNSIKVQILILIHILYFSYSLSNFVWPNLLNNA